MAAFAFCSFVFCCTTAMVNAPRSSPHHGPPSPLHQLDEDNHAHNRPSSSAFLYFSPPCLSFFYIFLIQKTDQSDFSIQWSQSLQGGASGEGGREGGGCLGGVVRWGSEEDGAVQVSGTLHAVVTAAARWTRDARGRRRRGVVGCARGIGTVCRGGERCAGAGEAGSACGCVGGEERASSEAHGRVGAPYGEGRRPVRGVRCERRSAPNRC